MVDKQLPHEISNQDEFYQFFEEVPIMIQCSRCGIIFDNFFEDEGRSCEELAKELEQDGWKKVNSEKYKFIGLVCPECIEEFEKDNLENQNE